MEVIDKDGESIGVRINMTTYSEEAITLMGNEIRALTDEVRYWRERAETHHTRCSVLSNAVLFAGKALMNGEHAEALTILLSAAFDDDVQSGAIDPNCLIHRTGL